MSRPSRSIEVICPQCQAARLIPPASVGSAITCSDCLEEFVARPIEPTASPPASRPPASHDTDGEALHRLLHPNLDTAASSSDTIRLDDDLTDDAYPVQNKQTLESDYDFTVVCLICHTRIDVNDSLIGTKVKCPDCYSPVDVRTPPPERRRAPFHAPADAADDDDFGLGAADTAEPMISPYHSIANDLLAKAESELDQQSPVAPRAQQEQAATVVRRAEQDTDEAAGNDRPDLPAAPFRTGVLSFLLDPITVARLIVLGVVLFAELGAVQVAIVSADEGPSGQFMSVLLRMVAGLFGIALATNLAVSMLGILQDSANGLDVIVSWPQPNFLDWMGEAIYLFSGLFVAVFPACVVAKILSLLGVPDSLFWVLTIGGSTLGVMLLFPFMLISMLESGSPIVPFSPPILRSVRLAARRWIGFTLLSSLVLGVGIGVGGARILWHNSALANFIMAEALIFIAAIYFRLIGRLVWCCDEAVLAEDIRLEEAADAE